MSASRSDDNCDVVPADDVGRINVCARNWARPGESIHPIPMDRIIIAEDGVDALTHEVRAAAGGRTLLVADHTIMMRTGEELKPLIEDALGRAVTTLTARRVPDDGAREFHAEIECTARLTEELRAYDVIVSVGSGSVTDAAKYARHAVVEQTGKPMRLICFPTAASVTAYTSSLAALTVDGVKRTLRARPPDVIVCDLPTLREAPRNMTQAGFADVLARGVSYGDWYLAIGEQAM